jgi:hypothetical protein
LRDVDAGEVIDEDELRQRALFLEAIIIRDVGLAPDDAEIADEGVRPAEPALRLLLAADDADAEQVVIAAAVETDGHHLAAIEQRIERQRLVDAAVPDLGAGPAVGALRHAGLDVEKLRIPVDQRGLAAADRLGALADQERFGSTDFPQFGFGMYQVLGSS